MDKFHVQYYFGEIFGDWPGSPKNAGYGGKERYKCNLLRLDNNNHTLLKLTDVALFVNVCQPFMNEYCMRSHILSSETCF